MQALTPGVDGPSIREWYRFLNCGFRLPIVGGTDKMSAEIPLGAIRTYARLEPGRPLSFESWADAVRSGRTFVTSGPFVELAVDGRQPGGTVRLGRGGGTVEVSALATAAQPVIAGLELIHDGAVIASTDATPGTDHLELTARVRVSRGGWLAAKVTSGGLIHSAFTTAMGAHTSPVYLEVPGRPTFDAGDATVDRDHHRRGTDVGGVDRPDRRERGPAAADRLLRRGACPAGRAGPRARDAVEPELARASDRPRTVR